MENEESIKSINQTDNKYIFAIGDSNTDDRPLRPPAVDQGSVHCSAFTSQKLFR